jgi:hypothetical protein
MFCSDDEELLERVKRLKSHGLREDVVEAIKDVLAASGVAAG